MALTDLDCKNAKHIEGQRVTRHFDERGLYLEVTKTGLRKWYFKYQQQGRDFCMLLGRYPAITLAAARKARDAQRVKLDQGINPAKERAKAKAAEVQEERENITFMAVAEEWKAKKQSNWAVGHTKRIGRHLDKDLYPAIGHLPIGSIRRADVVKVCEMVQSRGAVETAHRVLGTAAQVFTYALRQEYIDRTINLEAKDALKTPISQSYAAITDPQQLGALIRAMRAYQGGFIVKAALQLSALLFVRPGELRLAQWGEFDLDAALWTVPAARMKRDKQGKEGGAPHFVPLPKQAVAILKSLHTYTGNRPFVFPSLLKRDRTISDATLRTALASMGYGADVQSVHGFRATARTMLAEQLDENPLVIEAQLAHAVKDTNGRAYNRTQYLKQRQTMLQAWADYLDRLASGLAVVKQKAIPQRPKKNF